MAEVRKTQEELERDIKDAEKLVKVGGRYVHYKSTNHIYTLLGLAIQEATNKVCVIYRAEYGKNVTFVRDLDTWLSEVEVDGLHVKRFTLQE